MQVRYEPPNSGPAANIIRDIVVMLSLLCTPNREIKQEAFFFFFLLEFHVQAPVQHGDDASIDDDDDDDYRWRLSMTGGDRSSPYSLYIYTQHTQ